MVASKPGDMNLYRLSGGICDSEYTRSSAKIGSCQPWPSMGMVLARPTEETPRASRGWPVACGPPARRPLPALLECQFASFEFLEDVRSRAARAAELERSGS